MTGRSTSGSMHATVLLAESAAGLRPRRSNAPSGCFSLSLPRLFSSPSSRSAMAQHNIRSGARVVGAADRWAAQGSDRLVGRSPRLASPGCPSQTNILQRIGAGRQQNQRGKSHQCKQASKQNKQASIVTSSWRGPGSQLAQEGDEWVVTGGWKIHALKCTSRGPARNKVKSRIPVGRALNNMLSCTVNLMVVVSFQSRCALWS
jgi:hypothetical protein